MSILNKIPSLFGYFSPTVQVQFGQNNILHYQHQHRLSKNTVLLLKKNQIAVVICNGVRSTPFARGEHPLDIYAFPNAETVDILCLNTTIEVNRSWHSQYQPSERPLHATMTGNYIVSITNPMQFTEVVIDSRLSNPSDVLIDQWIAYNTDRILKTEQVSADDIEYQTAKLQTFLFKALKHAITPQGLILHDFSITPPIKSAAPSARQPAREILPKQMQTDSEESISEGVGTGEQTPNQTEEKQFYRVDNGEQIGPLSIMEIQQLIDDNRIAPEDLLWQKGMTSWQQAKSFPFFSWQ